MVALFQTIERFIHPRTLTHLWLLALAGIIGFIGNQIAARFACAPDTDCKAWPSLPTASTPAPMDSSA